MQEENNWFAWIAIWAVCGVWGALCGLMFANAVVAVVVMLLGVLAITFGAIASGVVYKNGKDS